MNDARLKEYIRSGKAHVLDFIIVVFCKTRVLCNQIII